MPIGLMLHRQNLCILDRTLPTDMERPQRSTDVASGLVRDEPHIGSNELWESGWADGLSVRGPALSLLSCEEVSTSCLLAHCPWDACDAHSSCE